MKESRDEPGHQCQHAQSANNANGEEDREGGAQDPLAGEPVTFVLRVTKKGNHGWGKAQVKKRQEPAEGEGEHVDAVRLDPKPMQEDRRADER